MTAPVRQIGSPGTTRIRDTSAQDVARDRSGRGWKRGLVIALVALALLAAVVLVARSAWWDASLAVPKDRLRIATVTRGAISREVSTTGTVVAAVSPTAYAPSAGIVTLNVKAGDLVQENDILAAVNSPELSSTLAQERATLDSLNTNLQRRAIEQKRQLLRSQQLVDLARLDQVAGARELRRAEAAWEIKVISRQDLEKAQDDVDKARVEFAHAEAAAQLEKESLEFEFQTLGLERDRQSLVVNELQRRVDDLTVRAPVTGMVGTIAVEQRSSVAANQPLVSIVDLSALEVEARIPESYSDDLAPGMSAQITFGGKSHAAVLHAMSPEIENSTVAGRVRFAGATPAGLRQNQRVTVSIELQSVDDALTVPRGPFLDSGAGRVIYVVEGDLAVRRHIRSGASGNGQVELLEGVSEGERVVVSSLEPFRGADRVLLTD